MSEKVNNSLTKSQCEELKACFSLFDGNKSGELDMNELKILSRFLGRNMCEEELQKVIDVVSKKRNLETISFTDFMNYMNKIGYRPATLAEVERVFKQMDTKRKGYLTMNDFLDSILAIKPHFPRNLIEDMFKQIDTDKTQRITLDKFMTLFD